MECPVWPSCPPLNRKKNGVPCLALLSTFEEGKKIVSGSEVVDEVRIIDGITYPSVNNEIMTGIYNQFSPAKANQLKQNISSLYCRDNEPALSCQKRNEKEWWN